MAEINSNLTMYYHGSVQIREWYQVKILIKLAA